MIKLLYFLSGSTAQTKSLGGNLVCLWGQCLPYTGFGHIVFHVLRILAYLFFYIKKHSRTYKTKDSPRTSQANYQDPFLYQSELAISFCLYLLICYASWSSCSVLLLPFDDFGFPHGGSLLVLFCSGKEARLAGSMSLSFCLGPSAIRLSACGEAGWGSLRGVEVGEDSFGFLRAW